MKLLLSQKPDLSRFLQDDNPSHERLSFVENHWERLLEEMAIAEDRLYAAQLAVLPSAQAANELKLFLDGVSEALKDDEELRPSNVDEVRDLSSKYLV